MGGKDTSKFLGGIMVVYIGNMLFLYNKTGLKNCEILMPEDVSKKIRVKFFCGIKINH